METPVDGLTYEAAQQICADQGRRLCTLEQWQTACQGLQGRAYPYGNEEAPGRCRADQRTDTPKTGPTGGRSRCITPEGAFDLVGNVAEWVDGGRLAGGSVLTPRPSCTTVSTPKANTAPPDAGVRCCVNVGVR